MIGLYIPQYITMYMKQYVITAFLALALLVPGSALASSDNVDVFVSGKTLGIKQVEGDKVKSDFEIKPESVVQVTQGTNLDVTTEPPNRVEKVKVTNAAGVMTELESEGNGEYSLFSFLAGAYLLDVIVDLPDSDKRAAYETVLIILEQGQQPVSTQEIVTKVKVITKIDIDFDDDDGKDRDGRHHGKKCSDKEGSAGLAFPYGKRTECELEKKQDCEKDRLAGQKWGDDCKDNNHAFDDDCEGFANQRECDDHWNTPPVTPPCEEVEPGTLCEDEGEASTPVCDETEILVDNRCEEIEIPVSPIIPDESEGVVPEEPDVEIEEPVEEEQNIEVEEETDEEPVEESTEEVSEESE
jgi:hypothetical protein